MNKSKCLIPILQYNSAKLQSLTVVSFFGVLGRTLVNAVYWKTQTESFYCSLVLFFLCVTTPHINMLFFLYCFIGNFLLKWGIPTGTVTLGEMFGVSGRTISEKEERAWFEALVIEFVDIFYWWEQLVGTVTGLLLIFEPDNLERDLELSTAFSWESFVYLTLTELCPVASLANSSLISLEALHATLFPLDIVLLGSGTTS